jgi:peptidoglycan/LPS O-acetylase OafA/YrhL
VLAAVALVSAAGLALDFDYPLVAPFLAVAIVLLLAIRQKQHTLGAFFGGLSYPLYLNHWIGVFVVNAVAKRFVFVGPGLRHVVSFVLNIAMAGALYWFVDRQILARRSQWYTPARARYAVILAFSATTIGVCVGSVLAFQR